MDKYVLYFLFDWNIFLDEKNYIALHSMKQVLKILLIWIRYFFLTISKIANCNRLFIVSPFCIYLYSQWKLQVGFLIV